MKIRTATLTAGFAVLATTLTGCGDPCAGMKPTAQDKIVFENGGEVEREGRNGTECEASRETSERFVEDE